MSTPKPVVINDPAFSELISDRIEYKLVDKQWEDGGVSYDSGWLICDKKALSLGMITQGVWLRFLVDDRTGSDSIHYVIESTFIDVAKLYVLKSKKFFLLSSDGLLQAKKKKDSFQVLTDKSESNNQLKYIYVQSEMGLILPIKLNTALGYAADYEQRLVIFSLMTGLFGVIFLYNLFLFFSLLDKVYIYYCWYVAMTYITQTITSSLGYQIFNLNVIFSEGREIFISVGGVALFTSLFLRYFFKKDFEAQKGIRYKKFLSYITYAGLVILLFGIFFPRAYSFMITNILMMFVAICCFIITIGLLREGVVRAKFILIAWTLFLLGAMLFMFSNISIIPYSSITQYTMPIGASLETVLLSFALGFRIHELEKEKKRSQMFALEQANLNQELELNVIRTQLKALRSQMNPHFIFNALNSIQSSIVNSNRQRAGNMLTKFSKLMRQMLEHSRQESIPLSEEVLFLENYFELEGMKEGKPFSANFDVDPELLEEDPSIPPSMIQPLCENALKHAFKYKNGDDNVIDIIVRKTHHEELIRIEVHDNGTGFINPEINFEKRAVGLSIIRERVALMNNQGKDASVEVISKSSDEVGHGTLVKVRLPLL